MDRRRLTTGRDEGGGGGDGVVHVQLGARVSSGVQMSVQRYHERAGGRRAWPAIVSKSLAATNFGSTPTPRWGSATPRTVGSLSAVAETRSKSERAQASRTSNRRPNVSFTSVTASKFRSRGGAASVFVLRLLLLEPFRLWERVSLLSFLPGPQAPPGNHDPSLLSSSRNQHYQMISKLRGRNSTNSDLGATRPGGLCHHSPANSFPVP